ncbi:hypothetical protein H6F96_16620 [Microcoleus sp. FACHB-53]|jgi:hypothetical protein|nr:hypothetical protein [Microcoleus sp. FACHB-53]MBD2127448.1 hypothetical protein [Microcoleus sp. FACHB-1]
MKNSMTWKYLFLSKAVINWAEFVGLLFGDQWIRELLNLKPLINPEYLHMFIVLIFIFGIGYWWVGNDLSSNRDLVKLGICAQSLVFPVLVYHTAIGNLHPLYLIPGVIDQVYSILFGLFLYSYNETKPALE